jgi:hypothetical protein
MTGFDDRDRRIAAWFSDETLRIPERTIEVAVAHAQAHPRRRDPLASLRRDPMARPLGGGVLFAPVPLLAAVGLIVLAILGAAIAGGFLDRPTPVVPPPSATPSTNPTASPSPALFHVDLVEEVGQDASIDITDRSASIVSAETGQPGGGGSVGADGIDVVSDPADPGVIVVSWTGSPCDTTHTLDIEADGRAMTVSRPRCEGDAIPRDLQLRLRYANPIDAQDITATLETR